MTNSLHFIGFLIAGIYFYLFQKTIKDAGHANAKRYIDLASGPKINIIGVSFILGMILIPHQILSISCGILAVIWVISGSYVQRSKMQKEKFENSFINKLFCIGFLVPIALICFLLGDNLF